MPGIYLSIYSCSLNIGYFRFTNNQQFSHYWKIVCDVKFVMNCCTCINYNINSAANIIALALANLLGGLFIIGHNVSN